MSLSATYISVDSFSVVGNYADYLIADRAVLCDCGADGVKKRIGVSSSYGAGVTTVTLKTDGTRNLTSNLTTIEWSVSKPGSEGNISLHGHADDDDGGPVSGAPAAHASTHENAGADEISVAGLSGELVDDQPPKAHASDHTDGTDDIQNAGASQKGLVSTGAQTLAGVKTFSSFPVTPSSAPTTDYQVANKKYVDDAGGGTRRMFFDVGARAYGDQLPDPYGDYSVQLVSNGDTAWTTFFVPAEASSLDAVYLVFIAGATDASRNMDLGGYYSANGEAYNTHTETDTGSTYSITNNQMTVIDITTKVFNSLAPGDQAGLEVHNNEAGDIRVLGVMIEYTI